MAARHLINAWCPWCIIAAWCGTSGAASDWHLRHGRQTRHTDAVRKQKSQSWQFPTHDVAMDATDMHWTKPSTAAGATTTGIAPVILFAQPFTFRPSRPSLFCATTSTLRSPAHAMNGSLEHSPTRRRAVLQRSAPRSDATESNGVPETPTPSPRSEWRVCRVCKQLYDPAQNGPDSCLHHTAPFTGRLLRVEPTDTSDLGFFYDCCGATSVDAPGCTRSYHQPYE